MALQATSADKEKDGGHETMEEEEQRCANDMKLLRPKFSNVKHFLRTRECMVQFLREGRGADFRLAVVTKKQVIS
jgi:hypothetical protein